MIASLYSNLPGLSLCIQGTFLHQYSYKSPARFIPVYTGNIRRCCKNVVIPAVYPCVYREHIYFSFPRSLGIGLSLCIQGTSKGLGLSHSPNRFIPVYTGNIPPATRAVVLETVYPCVYREHLTGIFFMGRYCGLSLCIQGTFSVALNESVSARFIPVYTGNM